MQNKPYVIYVAECFENTPGQVDSGQVDPGPSRLRGRLDFRPSWPATKYLSLSKDIIPQWILWKKGRRDWSIRASRVGHCRSLSISPTLLVLRHLLGVQRVAVLCTFSTCWIWVLQYGLQIGAAYFSLGRTKVLYTTSLVLLGTKAKFLRRKPKVSVASDEISEICWPQSIFSVNLYQDI